MRQDTVTNCYAIINGKAVDCFGNFVVADFLLVALVPAVLQIHSVSAPTPVSHASLACFCGLAVFGDQNHAIAEVI